jgi:hypothetical protein
MIESVGCREEKRTRRLKVLHLPWKNVLWIVGCREEEERKRGKVLQRKKEVGKRRLMKNILWRRKWEVKKRLWKLMMMMMRRGK